jgi:succinate dehydrogenase / fumarate reductase cytochrome b subunit
MALQPGRYTSSNEGQTIETWAWLLQRLSSIFLMFFLGAHLWVLHYATAGLSINWLTVSDRLRSPFFLFLDIGLLVLVLFHALNGVRAVVLDFSWFQQHNQVLTWILAVIFLSSILLGFVFLLPFMPGGSGR